MTRTSDIQRADAQDSVWIEIIRRMEEIYAGLADSQAEMERRTQELQEAKELADNIIRDMNGALIALDSNGIITDVAAWTDEGTVP